MTGSKMRRGTVLLVGVGSILLGISAPSSAYAHSAGTTPVASAYVARIASVPAGVEAAIIDGDQRLWMAVNPRLTVIVEGLLGEPFLRFSPGGVDENLNSPTGYLNRALPAVPPTGLTRTLSPRWSQLTTAHTYVWHEDRLHALATTGGAGGSWRIPLVVDGRDAAITGTLKHVPAPSRIWLWPAIVLIACLPAVLRLRKPAMTAAVARWLSLATLPAIVVARAGRELQGHPTVSLLQNVDLVATFAVAAVAGGVLLRKQPGRWPVAAFVVAVLGVYQGLALLPTLTQGVVLMAVPAVVARSAAIWSLGGGLGVLVSVVSVNPRSAPRHRPGSDPARAQVRTSA